METRFIICCALLNILCVKYSNSLNINETITNKYNKTDRISKCYVNVRNMYKDLIDKINTIETNTTVPNLAHGNLNITMALKKLEDNTNKLNVMAIVKKLEQVQHLYKPYINVLQKSRFNLQSKLKSNEEKLNNLNHLFEQSEKMLINATQLDSIINDHNKELKILSKEASYILDNIENLLILIISINETYDATDMITKQFHSNITELTELLNITNNHFKDLTENILDTENNINQTNLNTIHNNNLINNLEIPDLPKLDKCDNFELELADLVKKQNKYINDVENSLSITFEKQKRINETFKVLEEYEERADLAVKDINKTLCLLLDLKIGSENKTSNKTNNIKEKLFKIDAEIDNILHIIKNTNESINDAFSETNFLLNQTKTFDSQVLNITEQYVKLLDDLDKLNSTFTFDEQNLINKINLDEMKQKLLYIEDNYEDFNNTFQELLQEFTLSYSDRKKELSDIKNILYENEKSLVLLKEYIFFLNYFDFSEDALNMLENEIENQENILLLIEEKKYLIEQVEIVKKIYEELPQTGKEYCKIHIEIEPTVDEER